MNIPVGRAQDVPDTRIVGHRYAFARPTVLPFWYDLFWKSPKATDGPDPAHTRAAESSSPGRWPTVNLAVEYPILDNSSVGVKNDTGLRGDLRQDRMLL